MVLWTALLHEPLEEACDGARDRLEAMVDFLDPLIDRIAMPRRIADALRRIISVQSRLATGKTGRFARTELLGPALDVLELDLIARGKSLDIIDKMREDLPAPPHLPAARSVNRSGPWRRGGPRAPARRS